MSKLDLSNIPVAGGSRYPSPHDEPCKGRKWQGLGRAAGLTQFGVNRLVLDAGVWSSQRHWHTHEDEFVTVLEGEVILITDEGRATMVAGDSAGFPAGVQNGHHLINESEKPAVILVIGSVDNRDSGGYSDIDMMFLPDRYTGNGGFTNKAGAPLDDIARATLAAMKAQG